MKYKVFGANKQTDGKSDELTDGRTNRHGPTDGQAKGRKVGR
jgi:hypothetical protein